MQQLRAFSVRGSKDFLQRAVGTVSQDVSGPFGCTVVLRANSSEESRREEGGEEVGSKF